MLFFHVYIYTSHQRPKLKDQACLCSRESRRKHVKHAGNQDQLWKQGSGEQVLASFWFLQV